MFIIVVIIVVLLIPILLVSEACASLMVMWCQVISRRVRFFEPTTNDKKMSKQKCQKSIFSLLPAGGGALHYFYDQTNCH